MELSYGLETIGKGAFFSCTSLKSIIIPNSVKTIESTGWDEEHTFGNCNNLASVSIGNNVEKIPENCFSGDINLTSVIIGNNVKEIEYKAFENCTNLKSIKIPGSIKNISGKVFINCSKLESVELSYGLETIGKGAFFSCSSLKNIIIPNSVKTIESTGWDGEHTFGNCDNLASVFIPNSVTYIGDSCFDSGTIIKGYANSVADRYASENNLSFSTIPSVYAASIRFSEKQIVMYTDQVKYVSYTLLPSNTTDAIEWTSSNTNILEVNHLGKLTAKAPGSVSLMAQTTSGKRASITVIISNPPKSLAFKTKSRTLMSGQSYTQYALVDGGSRKDVVVSYTSSDPSIAFVDSKGKVTAKKGGTATITAKTFNGLKDTYKVTVRALPTYIKLNKSSLTLGIKETYKLKTSTPANSYVSKITFKSNHSNIATVDASGRVKAIKYGKAIITVKTNNGKTASCTVNVRKAPSKLKFNKAKLTLKPGRAYTLKLVYSNGTYSYSKKFTTSNSRVAVVNSSGKITAKKKGKATIKVRTFNGKQASCVVTVK